MPFIPHTAHDVETMMDTLDIKNTKQLFDEVPSTIPAADMSAIPKGLNEIDVTRLLQQREPTADVHLNFLGAGSYSHHIPAIVWQLASRGEFYTAYTPYQAEASQGSLQVIYEYQTIMANLMGMEVSNASLYDGASAVAEAVLMAVRIKRSKKTTVLIPRNVHPRYRAVLHTITQHQDITLTEVDFDQQGALDINALDQLDISDVAALMIAQPNFFGSIEQVDQLTDWAHSKDLLVIATVNPMAMALYKQPGSWGQNGADIVCGEGQPFGIPMAGGGPYFGFMCCNKKNIRQLPGRIVGRTHDEQGNVGYTLTLQAREQHIRRAKATSNICTNQGLAVTAATIYMSLMGFEGLKQTATRCYQNTQQLKQQLQTNPNIEIVFDQLGFHEFIYRHKKASAADVLACLQQQGIQGGYDLSQDYPELKDAILVCATETKSSDDIAAYVNALQSVGA
ncbi:MAG: aminomethyl-transferring glycine dehydrogenase subunit GcvPA [Coxiellaceae bacterium]|nr:aminomethyl-transferring glycine dehydrogenase subunit GcvPA [Coxiellaceae bacterium]